MRLRERIGATGPQRIVVDGVKLAYDDHGSGPVVLCLHAIGHGAGDFVPLRKRLVSRYRVIALDWPNHGASDAVDAAPTDELYCRYLEGFVAALGLERI